MLCETLNSERLHRIPQSSAVVDDTVAEWFAVCTEKVEGEEVDNDIVK